MMSPRLGGQRPGDLEIAVRKIEPGRVGTGVQTFAGTW